MTRVIHVNDVAGVASAAVRQARTQGLDWQLWPLPGVRGVPLPTKVARRARDLARFRPTGRSADLLHVHYGLFGYYAWSVHRPYVLHLHGTDVRVNLDRTALGPLVRRAIRHADEVVYSTPDLGPAVTELRADAWWIPAPLSPELDILRDIERPPVSARASPRVVFASRWDPVKGLDLLIDAAARLKALRPEIELVGVDWGPGAVRAAEAGVRLEPMLPAGAFRELLASADVVVGQQLSGALGVSDLEAMALGRPLVAYFTTGDAYPDPAPLWNTLHMDVPRAVEAVLDDPVAAADRASEGRSWALRHHSAAAFVHRLVPVYDRIVRAHSGRE